MKEAQANLAAPTGSPTASLPPGAGATSLSTSGSDNFFTCDMFAC